MRDSQTVPIVLPEICLFADQAGEVFKIVTEDCDLHTVLRLPRGTFTPYSHGSRQTSVFFIKGAKRSDPQISQITQIQKDVGSATVLGLPLEICVIGVICGLHETNHHQGGHHVAASSVRRRFKHGWRNFEQVYQRLVDHWRLDDNSGDVPILLAEGDKP